MFVTQICIPMQERGNEETSTDLISFPRSCVGTHTILVPCCYYHHHFWRSY